MNNKNIETTIVDEANERTYIVIAGRMLSEGEAYKAIRQELLRRKGHPVGRGETLIIDTTRVLPTPKPAAVIAPVKAEAPKIETCDLVVMANATN